MNLMDVNVQTPLWRQEFKAIDLDGKTEVTVTPIGRVEGREKTLAVHVAGSGAGRWMCLRDYRLFKVGGYCPQCAGADSDVEPVSRVVTPPNSGDNAPEVN